MEHEQEKRCRNKMVTILRNITTIFYYVCRKRRQERTCNKENARKEYAERLVASELKEYVLRDDVIEWVADSVLKFQETLKGQSQLAYYQDKLVEVKRSLDNIMKAIEAGAFSNTSRHA